MSALPQTQGGRQSSDIRLADFSGGLVSVPNVKGQAQLGMTELERSQNIDTSGKSLRKMKGFSKLTSISAAGDVSSIFYDEYTRNTYVAYANKIGKLVANEIVQLTGATGYTNNSIRSFARVGDYLLSVNRYDAPVTWNEGTSTLAAITTPPATWVPGSYPEFCSSWMGRGIGVLNNDDLLYYSSLYDVNVWTAGTSAASGGAQRIGRDGKPIKAIIPLATGLLIFKDSGLYFFSGDQKYNTGTNVADFDQTTFTWDLISPAVDCLSHRSCIVVGESAYVWGRYDVYKISQSQATGKVSVQSIGASITTQVLAANALPEQVCAAHYQERHQIWFGVTSTNSSAVIDTVYCYDYGNVSTDYNASSAYAVAPTKVGGWMMRKGYNHKCMANVTDATGNQQIYTGGYAATPYIYKQNATNNFDGAAMECIAWSAWVPLGNANQGKTHHVTMMLGPQTNQPVSYSYAYDFNSGYYDSDTLTPDAYDSTWNSGGGSIWTTDPNNGTWQTANPFLTTMRIFGKGRRIQHRFYSNLVSSDFDILEILHPTTFIGYA